jgi:DNA polymerase III delta prime subunit
MSKIRKLWVEEYRPHTLNEYVFQDLSQRELIERWLAEGSIPHLLFCGVQGSGKTALARILISALDIDEMDLLTINASDKTGIDYIRDTISAFTESLPMGKLKVVHLEESDHLSHSSQAMLRALMEDTSDTCRFIMTCNYENKIIPAIKSRLQVMRFKAPSEDETFARMVMILDTEGVSFDPEVLYSYITVAYPDIRKIINNLELNTANKVLKAPRDMGADADYRFKILELITQGDFQALYELSLKQVSNDELEGLYEFVWQNLKHVPRCKADVKIYEKAVLVIADALRAHAVSAFPHITFQAMCIKLIMVVAG